MGHVFAEATAWQGTAECGGRKSAAINVAAMADGQDQHFHCGILDLIDDSIIPDSNPIEVRLAGEFYATGRTRIFLQTIKGAAQAEVERRLPESGKEFLSSPAEEN